MISPRAEVELGRTLRIGRKSQVSSFVKIKSSDGPLTIGSHVHIGTNCFISSHRGGVRIGDYAMISPNVCIIGNNYKHDALDTPIVLQEITSLGIEIGDNVWLGSGTVVVDGANIGSGCIVAPNSVVRGTLPPNTISEGNPAVVVFERR